MDRIIISFEADDDINNVIQSNKEHIMSETLADDIKNKSDIEIFDINGHKTGISVERI